MPISDSQAKVLKLISSNRSPESYLAGATVIHRDADTPRFSQDIDFFHDIADSIAQSADRDVASLREAGYDVSWLLRTPAFHRAVTTLDKQQLKIEWAQDSAFRFFPVQEDERFGYRLHDADAATNKILALAGRDEIRDFVDVLHLHKAYLSLGAMVWAACGKDPGFSPEFLLGHVSRHTAYTQTDLNRLRLRVPMDLMRMKQDWLAALADARKLFLTLPPKEIGCLYLDMDRNPVTPDASSGGFRTLIRHRGCIRGAWPLVSAYGSE
jgi:hypothetical protein